MADLSKRGTNTTYTSTDASTNTSTDTSTDTSTYSCTYTSTDPSDMVCVKWIMHCGRKWLCHEPQLPRDV
jgi:hypothetical protein